MQLTLDKNFTNYLQDANVFVYLYSRDKHNPNMVNCKVYEPSSNSERDAQFWDVCFITQSHILDINAFSSQ